MTYIKNTLNNMTLRNSRRTQQYQAVLTDLALAGVISREKAEMILGYEIPEYLQLPDGTNISANKKKEEPKKPDLSKLKDI